MLLLLCVNDTTQSLSLQEYTVLAAFISKEIQSLHTMTYYMNDCNYEYKSKQLDISHTSQDVRSTTCLLNIKIDFVFMTTSPLNSVLTT